ncbi:MAG TPA: DJ-1/PfpI family protein [Tepidimicrobium sp.]|nr:DJ-1/PfpI family protein [Tepidimicrobium sp.]
MKIAVFLADGFEEIEALTVVDYLRRMDITVDTISIAENEEVRGAHDIVVMADKVISRLGAADTYDGLVIPGGLPGATNLRDNQNVIDMVKKIGEEGKLVAAICAGPIVLERAGLIKDKKVTSYPGFEEELKDSIYKQEPVIRDDNIITAMGPALAGDFAIEIVAYLLGKEKAKELKEDILYSYIYEN